MSDSPGLVKGWPRNVRLFLLFRVFFNARYYYPIFALFFLDLGLTLPQFAALNALWALVIVTLEVPSGALADVVGRLPLLRLAALLMVVEMVCLLVPRLAPDWLLLSLALNRICSGAAEALASGCDEALAYDSLSLEQRHEWPRVLELQMRYLNAAMMVAMLVGAASYDPALWKRFLDPQTAAAVAGVAPVVLTLVHAMVAVVVVFLMQEQRPAQAIGWMVALRSALGQTLNTLRWLIGQPTARLVLLSAVVFDHMIRQGLVVSSDYLNAIGISKAYLGPLGAVAALASSFFATPLARMARQFRPATMFWLLYGALMIVSYLLAHPRGVGSAMGIIALSLLAGAVGYLTSLYLNQVVSSERRATLLSVKGLAMNLGFGWVSLAYATWVARLPAGDSNPPVITAFAAYLPYGTILVLIITALAFGQNDVGGQPGGYQPSPAEPSSTVDSASR